MLIILLLVLISEFTFFMDAEEDFPDRLNTSITVFLSLKNCELRPFIAVVQYFHL